MRKPKNLDIINRSFTVQAPNFESKSVNFSKAEFLKKVRDLASPKLEDVLLEVAAGTGACGRYFAPLVQRVVCLDATDAMLRIGKQEADKDQLTNMVFVKGYAEELPFPDASFTIVLSRLAFHHFTDPAAIFSEMVRVLKPGGKLIMIDMEAAVEPLRNIQGEIETLRDPSHVRMLSKTEMLNFFFKQDLIIEVNDTTNIKQKLDNWMALTQTPKHIQSVITKRMKAELDGHAKTGFFPFVENGDICFYQKWVTLIGIKKTEKCKDSVGKEANRCRK